MFDLSHRQRLVLYFASFFASIVIYTFGYMWGMAALEGRERTVAEAINVVFQTYTTVGYGQDAPWETTYMNLLVVLMGLTGVAFVSIALPTFVIPWMRDLIEEAVEDDESDSTEGIEDHVVIVMDRYPDLADALAEEFERREVDAVIVEGRPDDTDYRHRSEAPVVRGSPSSPDPLASANIAEADAALIDAPERRNANTILAAREYGNDLLVNALVDDVTAGKYLRYAGADDVLSPRQFFSQSLANKAAMDFETDLDELDAIEGFELVELRVEKGSELHGEELSSDPIEDRSDARLIGAWIRGNLVQLPAPDEIVTRNAVLVVAGSPDGIDAACELTGSDPIRPSGGSTVILGYGLRGLTTEGVLERAEVPTTTVDIEDKEGVDVVGDATDEQTLRDAGVDEADNVIVTLADDDEAVLASMVAEEIGPQAEIIVGVDNAGNVDKAYRAGADYTLSYPEVSSRMIADSFFDDADTDTSRHRLELERLSTSEFEPEGVTGTFVGVIRNGSIDIDIDPEEVEETEEVIVAGTESAIDPLVEGE